MRLPLVTPRRAGRILLRHGPTATLGAITIVAFAALAALCTNDHRGAEALAANQATEAAVDRAEAVLDRQQRGLDELAKLAATRPDAAVQQFLDQLPALEPGLHGAALADAAGVVQQQNAARGRDDTTVAALAAEAASLVAARPDAAMLVTQTVREADGDTPLVGLAHPWRDAEGGSAGFALVAVDPTAFTGLNLLRTDGTPLFGQAETTGAQLVALGDAPLMLAVPAAHGSAVLAEWYLIALATIGAASTLGLLAILTGRLNRAARRIAEHARVERELRRELAAAADATGRIDELSRTKSQFFAQVTHELRTPLNAILGFSETIQHEMFGPVANARYLQYAGLIHDAGAHLLSLINDLLDNARIEAGKMEIAPIRVSAPALARSALDLVELLAAERNIAMTTVGLSTCPDLNIDPRAMKQVLVNLLSNAIKYTPPGGRIDIRFSPRSDGGAAIAITDTGIGMSADDLRAVFEPFGRAGRVEARRQQGTGLGLSLARALVRLHGGDLTLTSRPDFGTTATVALPANAVFGAANAHKTPSAEASARAA